MADEPFIFGKARGKLLGAELGATPDLPERPPGDPLLLSGEVTVAGTTTFRFADAEEYDRFVRGNFERSPVRATFEAHFSERPREHRPCLWGWRKGYVQYGSPDDRWEEMLSRGEVSLVVPQVEYERDAAALRARAAS